MFTLKIIKNSFYKNIYNNFSPESPNWWEIINNNPFQWDSLQDLKQLKAFIDDWKIDSREAQIINEHFNDIEKEARDWLKEMTSSMLKEGFSAIDKNSYESFKKLIEKTNQIKLPSWQNMVQKLWTILDKNIQVNQDSDFHWIIIKNNTIQIRYNHLWFSDTLVLNYNKETGELLDKNIKWSEIKDEEEDVKNQSNIDKNLLNDNIKNKEIQQQKELEKINKLIKEIKLYSVDWKNIKELEQQKNNLEQLLKLKVYSPIEWIITEAIDKINNKISILKQKQETKRLQEEKQEQEKKLQEAKIKKAIEWYRGKPKEKIKKIQKKLWIPVDGIVWKQTVSAIMDFQKNNQLVVDGIAWKNTLKKLWCKNPENFYNNKKYEKVNKNETRKNNENKSETTNTIIEKQDKVEIKYKIEKKDVIQAAMKFLKENSFNSINTQAPIWTYTIDGETHNIVLKWEPWNYKVELDWTGVIDDYDQKVLWDTVEDITKAVNKLVESYKKKLEEEKKNKFPKVLWTYINYEWKKEKIKLYKQENPSFDWWEDNTVTYIIKFEDSTKTFSTDLSKSFDHLPSDQEIQEAIKELSEKNKKYIESTDEYKENKFLENLWLNKEIVNNLAEEINADYNGIKEKKWIKVIELDRTWTNDINIWIDKNNKIVLFDDSGLVNIKEGINKENILDITRKVWAYLSVINTMDRKIHDNENMLTDGEEAIVKYLQKHNKIDSVNELNKVIEDLRHWSKWALEEVRKDTEKKEKFKEILKKLKKEINSEVEIKIDSWDYKGKKYKLDFEIDWDKLVLDSKWNQPWTDKEVKINMDKIVWKSEKEIKNYINSLKDKLINEYKKEVAKSKMNTFDDEWIEH